jgi:hypothetical protein
MLQGPLSLVLECMMLKLDLLQLITEIPLNFFASFVRIYLNSLLCIYPFDFRPVEKRSNMRLGSTSDNPCDGRRRVVDAETCDELEELALNERVMTLIKAINDNQEPKRRLKEALKHEWFNNKFVELYRE